MRRLVRPLAYALLAAVSAVAGSFANRAVLAQDAPTPEEVNRRVEWVRQLPPDERAKLKEALARFRSLPAAERDGLRKKAAKVGPERLEGLAGRDLAALKHSRSGMVAETDAILEAIGRERLSVLADDERAYVRSEAMRGFQRHVQRRLLNLTTYDELEKMPAAEKKARIQDALRRIVEDRLSRLPDDERARLQALAPQEKAAVRVQMFTEYRMDETRDFAKVFDRFRVQPFLQMPAEKRAERVRKWREQARWFAVVRTLKDEVGIGDEARRALASLGPSDWARVNLEVGLSEQDPPTDRRLRLETLIQRLAGERALDPARRGPAVNPLLRSLRERRLMLNGTGTPEKPGTPAPPARR